MTADDYGASRNIDHGILQAVEAGCISEISAFGNFRQAIPELKRLSEAHPSIGVGAHLNLTTGRPALRPEEIPTLVHRDGCFQDVADFCSRIQRHSVSEIETEFRAQIEALTSGGLRLDHLSDHNGLLSLYPPFFDVLRKLAREYQVALRSPVAASIAYPELFPRTLSRRKAMQVALHMAFRNPWEAFRLVKHASAAQMHERAHDLDARGIVHPDLLLDALYGDPTIENAMRILERIPTTTAELVLHLSDSSRPGGYPSGLDVGYFPRRERELAVATSPELRQYAVSLHLELIGFRDLPRA